MTTPTMYATTVEWRESAFHPAESDLSLTQFAATQAKEFRITLSTIGRYCERNDTREVTFRSTSRSDLAKFLLAEDFSLDDIKHFNLIVEINMPNDEMSS